MKRDLIATDEKNTKQMNSSMLTFEEAALYLKVSKSFLYKVTSDRTITFYKPTGGKLIYFNRDDLDAWLTKNRFPSKTELKNLNNGGFYGGYRL
jgi:excisionase family DNA binding protein